MDQLAAEQPDLVLLDVMMPHLDGFAVLQRIRAERETQRLPVIMLTARDESTARVKGLKGGANDYVAKHIADQKGLVQLLQRHIRSVQDLAEAVARITADNPQARILICGSLYLAGSILRYHG